MKSATYSGDTPVSADGYTFAGWMPSGKCIRDSENAMAQFFENREITDSWEDIIQSIKDKTYKAKYKQGNYKMLDLGTEGTIPMRITAMNRDRIRIGGPTASITWIATRALNTNSMWGYTNSAERVSEEADSFCFVKGETFLTWDTYELQEDVTINDVIELECTLPSDRNFYLNMYIYGWGGTAATLTSYENDVQISQAQSGSVASVHVVGDGTAHTYKFVFARDSDPSRYNSGRVQCSSIFDEYIKVKSCNKVVAKTRYRNGTSYYGGWEYSKLREYLNSTIYGMLPDVLKKGGIKEVEKESASVTSKPSSSGSNSTIETCITRDKLWAPSICEIGGATLQEYSGQDFIMEQSVRAPNKECWLRSLYIYNGSTVYGVYGLRSDGSTSSTSYVANSRGVLIGFST